MNKKDANLYHYFRKYTLVLTIVLIGSTSTVLASDSKDFSFLNAILLLILDGSSNDVETDEEAVHFLMSATFGPTNDSVDELKSLGYSSWFQRQTNLSINSLQAETNRRQLNDIFSEEYDACLLDERFSREAWFDFAITGEDQLRQRVAFALSQLFVVATHENNIKCKTLMQGHYMDVLQEGAFGNFRDLLEDITYHTFMAMWLTYINNEKANPDTGSAPDENYAREIMQLFTIGLVDLNMDGSPKLDSEGNMIESYTQDDVTELAKVFTGLHRAGEGFGGTSGFDNRLSDITRLQMDNRYHSSGTKTVLGVTIPSYSDGNLSISDALDILAEHPNTAPFIAKHLIQRLTTSNPSPTYIYAVANAFKSGVYKLPNGNVIGSRKNGDLEAAVAAVLFTPEARSDKRFMDITYGKVREPILRFTHWARVSGVNNFTLPWFSLDSSRLGKLGQDLPLRARSVFNFFRPGYVDTGSETANANLVAPELQIEFGPNTIKYANAMRAFSIRPPGEIGYYPDYNKFGLIDIASSSDDIIDYYNLIYTGNRLHPETIQAMHDTLDQVPASTNNVLRLQVATILITNTIEYKTQK